MADRLVRIGDDYSIDLGDIRSLNREGATIEVATYSGDTVKIAFKDEDGVDADEAAIEAFEYAHETALSPEEHLALAALDRIIYDDDEVEDDEEEVGCVQPGCPNGGFEPAFVPAGDGADEVVFVDDKPPIADGTVRVEDDETTID